MVGYLTFSCIGGWTEQVPQSLNRRREIAKQVFFCVTLVEIIRILSFYNICLIWNKKNCEIELNIKISNINHIINSDD